jgi:hypothetical protein
MNRADKDIFRPITDLAKFASVMATGASSLVSGRYSFIPTTRALAVLADYGWVPVRVTEARTRDERRAGYQKHAVILRSARELRALAVGETVPEIMLVNSHVGSAAFELSLALYEKVCANGLMVAQGGIERRKIRHVGFTEAAVAEAIEEVVPFIPRVLEGVERFKAIELEERERRAFATAAIELRWDEESGIYMRPEEALMVRRTEQRGPDLYTVMNVVQENLVRGGGQYQKVTEDGRRSGKPRRARPIAGLDANIGINRALWRLTEEMARIKTGAGPADGARQNGPAPDQRIEERRGYEV